MEPLTRPPTVAGSFYPAEAGELRAAIRRWLNRAEAAEVGAEALIVPHAGYEYSGETASNAYAQVLGRVVKRVIVLAPSHFDMFGFAAVFPGDAYETPLGRIATDGYTAERLARECPAFHLSMRGHYPSREHALEVQLPFLQVALGHFELVPVVVGELSAAQCQSAAEALQRVCAEDHTLLVASSDLSHYHPAARAEELDHRTVEAIESGDASRFLDGVEKGQMEACGAWPVAMVMMAKPGRWHLLRYSNSGDVIGERGAVVGYAALASA